VRVLEAKDGKLKLSMKEPVDLTSFQGIDAEQWLPAVVDRLAPNGAFVTVTPPGGGDAKQGLVSKGEIDRVVTVGEEVKVRVLEAKDGKLKLSMKEPVDLTSFQGIDAEQWLPAVVDRLAPNGAFVTVTPPGGEDALEGLVRITELTDRLVDKPEDVVEVGQEVKVRVIAAKDGKLDLSMREPSA